MRILSSRPEDLALAAAALVEGRLVAFPTETVYGLGADVFNKTALAQVFDVKRRPSFDPLIVHIADCQSIDRIVAWERLSALATDQAERLIRELWPGPLTLILPKRPEVPDLVTSGLSTVAVRLPAHPIARRLIELSTGAIAAPSANPFGYLSPTRVSHVIDGLGDSLDFVVDGGPCELGVESTILDLSSDIPTILRPGGLNQEGIEAIIGSVRIVNRRVKTITAPGQLPNHYAPRVPLFLYPQGALADLRPEPSEALVFFTSAGAVAAGYSPALPTIALAAGSATAISAGPLVRYLAEGADSLEAAANLFDVLHELDRAEVSAIHAEYLPEEGLGPAINDRLFKASCKS